MIHVFVVNSIVAGSSFSEKLRNHLKEREDFTYHVFNTSEKGMETEMVDRMIRFFDGERIRFYACGGSGTMRNVLQGGYKYKHAEFAFCPLGETNDFLKVFGDDIAPFKDIDRLIDGEVRYIDYIKTNYGCALNTVSFGIDSVLSETLENLSAYRIFGRHVPMFLAYVKAILGIKSYNFIYTVDNQVMNDNITELVVANGCVFGGGMRFDRNPDIRDGKMKYIFATNQRAGQLLKIILSMLNGDLEGLGNRTISGECKSFSVQSVNGADIAFNLDGEVIQGGNTWNIEIVRQGIGFVIPNGVKILEETDAE